MSQETVKAMDTANTVRSSGKILPREDVKIYSSGKGKAAAHLGEAGTEHTVHAVLADKLVRKGAATLEAPKKKTEKVEGGEGK